MRATARLVHPHVALLTCQSTEKTTPEARLPSTRVLTSHGPSRFRAGTPLRRWGTLAKSRAKSPIFARAAPLVAGGLRELRTLRPGQVPPPAFFYREPRWKRDPRGRSRTRAQSLPAKDPHHRQFLKRSSVRFAHMRCRPVRPAANVRCRAVSTSARRVADAQDRRKNGAELKPHAKFAKSAKFSKRQTTTPNPLCVLCG